MLSTVVSALVARLAVMYRCVDTAVIKQAVSGMDESAMGTQVSKGLPLRAAIRQQVQEPGTASWAGDRVGTLMSCLIGAEPFYKRRADASGREERFFSACSWLCRLDRAWTRRMGRHGRGIEMRQQKRTGLASGGQSNGVVGPTRTTIAKGISISQVVVCGSVWRPRGRRVLDPSEQAPRQGSCG